MTDKRTTRKTTLEEIKGIQNGLKERNEIQREVISYDLMGLIDKLKKTCYRQTKQIRQVCRSTTLSDKGQSRVWFT